MSTRIPGPLGQLTSVDKSRAGLKIARRILGIHAALHGAAARTDVRLPQPQAAALGDGDLLGDEVHAGHRLGHRMLHLDAGVHFQKIERLALAGRPGTPPCQRPDSAGGARSGRRPRAVRLAARRADREPVFPRSASDSGAGPSSRARPDESHSRCHPPGSALPRGGRNSHSAPGTGAGRRTRRQPPTPPFRALRAIAPGSSTRFMPRPPPPPTALTSSGVPICRARASAASRQSAAPPGTHGNVRRLRPRRARATYRPRPRSGAAVGPMKITPCCSHSRASCGTFREKAVSRMDGIGTDAERRLHDGLGLQITGTCWRRSDADGAVGEPGRQ